MSRTTRTAVRFFENPKRAENGFAKTSVDPAAGPRAAEPPAAMVPTSVRGAGISF